MGGRPQPQATRVEWQVTFVGLLISVSQPWCEEAHGGALPSSPRADRCDSPQTQAEMNVCAAEELRHADAQLNAVYRKLTATSTCERI